MYLFSSTSQQYAPLTRSRTIGSPPTDLNARTGELTPPGIRPFASLKILLDFAVLWAGVVAVIRIDEPVQHETNRYIKLQRSANWEPLHARDRVNPSAIGASASARTTVRMLLTMGRETSIRLDPLSKGRDVIKIPKRLLIY